MKDGDKVDALYYNGNPVAINLPMKVELKVASAPEGVKGNSAGAITKTVVLENDLEIRTPLFIKSGDKVIINTETGEYVERV